ncbi:MAG: cyanophycinase [Phaeodactylibacter sp.]|uniref:cyanophycinase n=1 Tax=Phaeodactylibacter sp. TaxID=1940289 RepID=UPI0032EF52EB
MRLITLLLIFMLSAVGCADQTGLPVNPAAEPATSAPLGKLFIIGGGKRPPGLVQSLVQASGLDQGGYGIILPMSSGEPDTSAYYAIKQFTSLGLEQSLFRTYNFQKGAYPKPAIDSLRNARLIYITGGDQNRFMEVVADSPVYEAIHEAYQAGATIAGTSAGAAVMSDQMITGNEHRHPEYTGDFRTIESENMEIAEGLGLLNNAIIDQHFIWRMRMNRLITVVLDHPDQIGIGIDESTAILVEDGRFATVHGQYQVITLRHPSGMTTVQDSLLGGRGLELGVLLPGDTLSLQ